MDLERAAILSLAFFVAVAVFRRHRAPAALAAPREALRYPSGLVIAAVVAHAGAAVLYFDRIELWSVRRLSPDGPSILLVPLGVLLMAPWSARREVRVRYLAAALLSLLPAFAVARLGCWLAECCVGIPTSLPWGVAIREGGPHLHPVALYEMGVWLILYLFASRLPTIHVPSIILLSFGMTRLWLTDLRAPPPLGEPVVPVAAIAWAWVVCGAWMGGMSLLRIFEVRAADASGGSMAGERADEPCDGFTAS